MTTYATLFTIPEIVVTGEHIPIIAAVVVGFCVVSVVGIIEYECRRRSRESKEDDKRFVAPIGTTVRYWNSKGEYRKSRIESVTITETRRMTTYNFTRKRLCQDKETKVKLVNGDIVSPSTIEEIGTND